MIESFLASWSLFHNTYVTGWLIAVLLAVVGVLVVARDQIFIGAAVSQASMLGIAMGMWLGSSRTLAGCSWCRSDAFLSLCGGAFAVLGAVVTAGAGRGRESSEAITGWVFLLAGSLAVLAVAHSPHGMEEVHRLLSSTIIGATRSDVAAFAILTLLTAAAVTANLRTLLLLVMDEEMARAVGVRVALWNRALAVWLGVAVGLSIRVSGVAYAFGCLVLPALVAKHLCRRIAAIFLAAPTIGLISAVAAFVLANYYDEPPGQIAVTLLASALAVAWLVGRARPRS